MNANAVLVVLISTILVLAVLMYEKSTVKNTGVDDKSAAQIYVNQSPSHINDYSSCMSSASNKPTELGVKTAVDECKRVHIDEPKQRENEAFLNYFDKLPDGTMQKSK